MAYYIRQYYEEMLLTASSRGSFLCRLRMLSIALCTWALISSSSGQCFFESVLSHSSRSLFTATVPEKNLNEIIRLLPCVSIRLLSKCLQRKFLNYSKITVKWGKATMPLVINVFSVLAPLKTIVIWQI